MKRSYSSLNILQKRLSGFTEKGFFHFLFTNHKYITVSVPFYDYLRGRVFVEDLFDNFADEVSLQFSLDDLIFLLYDDFLTQIKKGVAKHEQIALYLIDGYKKFFQKKVIQKRVMRPIANHVFEFETIEEEEEPQHSNDEKKAYLRIRMRESEILRGEVLIHDLEPFMEEGITVTIEQVIAIVYLEFIESVKKEGNSLKVQQSILAHIKKF